MAYITGDTIKRLREEKHLTQRELAEQLLVTDKAVSKWETGRGLPDITLLEDLAKALSVSLPELLTGNIVRNHNVSANMKRSCFYVCPICGNIVHTMGRGAFSCCGVSLPVLEAEGPDTEHVLVVETIEHDYYIHLNHPMTKEHYISFFAYVTDDKIQLVKLYPEQPPEARFQRMGTGKIFAYCKHHGLFGLNV